MMTTFLSSTDICRTLAKRVRTLRLTERLTQEGLAKRSGVSLGTLKKFEHTGKISLESLAKLSITLNRADELAEIFHLRAGAPESIDELLKTTDDAPKRGTKK